MHLIETKNGNFFSITGRDGSCLVCKDANGKLIWQKEGFGSNDANLSISGIEGDMIKIYGWSGYLYYIFMKNLELVKSILVK